MYQTWTSRLQSKRLWLFLILLTALLIWLFSRPQPAQGAEPAPTQKPAAGKPQGKTQGASKGETKDKSTRQVATAPRYISIKGLKQQRKFVAGDTGKFEVLLYLARTTDDKGNTLRWNPADPASTRAVLSVSVPKASGIRFGKGKKPSNELTVKVDVSKPQKGLVAVQIPYTVSSRVRVKTYPLRIHLSAPLVTSDGGRIQDSGSVTVKAKVNTPLFTKLIVIAILFVAVFLFIVEWVRVDVVAMLMMVSLPLLNLLDSKATFTGLSSNAVIAIIGVMIVSAGLNKVGLVSGAVKPVIRAAGSSASKLMVYLSSFIAVISSVMQNTGAAVLFLPGIRNACKVMKIQISKVLMAIGMCAILGGTLTMIGTSPLILLNDILPEGVEKFGLLELTPIGLGFVIAGIIYFYTIGGRFLTQISEAQRERGEVSDVGDHVGDITSFYESLDGPFEIRVPTDWERTNDPETITEIRMEYGASVVAMLGNTGTVEMAPTSDRTFGPGMSICIYGPTEEVARFARDFGLELLETPNKFKILFNPAVAGTVEAVVSPRSSIIGSTIREIGFRDNYGVTTLAVHREGKTYYKEKSDIPLMSGDALLMHAKWEHLQTLQEAHQNFRIITPLEAEIQAPGKSKAAILCFVTALTLMIISSFYFQKLPYNPIPLSVCLMVGAVGMVVTGVLSIQHAYKAVDWRTVFLLGGLIPLGMAVDRTGTAEWIATGVVSLLGSSVTPLVLIIVLAVLSTVFCLVISNVGACTLLVPLGASMAMQIGVDPRVAAIVVGLGVSNSFLLPTHQVNALYMGPGSYRTKDYIKIGGGMSLIYILVLVSMTYFFYLP